MKKSGDNHNFKEEISVGGAPWTASALYIYE